ncbi:MAG: phosphotransferase [Deltaproteobacteria bacterium]|nr:phosphotransferase [Deltaproteobacteria bacterium]
MIYERLASVASQLRRFARERAPEESVLEWPGGMRLTRLRAVKARRGHITNKGGRIVLRGDHGAQPIKLYEAYTVEHAEFIEALSKHDAVGAWFPVVRARHGRCVVTDWVEGVAPPDDVSLDEIARIEAAFHAVPADRLPAPGYDFWQDFLRPRFVRAADMIGTAIDDILAPVDAETARPERVVVHPDFRPANMVRDPQGRWVVIDNEYCTTSALPLLDVCHTARAFKDRSQQYWQAYVAITHVSPSHATLTALRGAWLARIVGSAFVAGKIGKAADALRDHRAGKNLLPFTPHGIRA